MSLDREAIYSEVFQRLQTLTGSAGVVTCSRRLKAWDDVPPTEQPAIFLKEGAATSEQRIGVGSIWKLKAEVYVYATDTTASGPVTKLNQLVKAVDDAFKLQAGEARDPLAQLQPGQTSGDTTLGGLALYCSIQSVETDEGILGDQGVAIIDLEIVAPG